ncbi:CPBP family intramembrane glutamic endopeptidase [Flagellimonas profundi]|uniref:CPBP family intramembrane metalloprotease n=1 Tax=Flagellimonas profundi TaxID=2915620 RepID=A0ABS3FDW0_9FLAO|nr:CPBP family intramembrane glutamic endopeptidase [Allomuricauda profundi]MBO0340900.1 CPBP family intramembrane metalloprotease [Allomuricauda profundi]
MNEVTYFAGWKRVLLIILPYFFITGFLQVFGELLTGQEITSGLINESTGQHLLTSFFGFLGTLLVVYLFMKRLDNEEFIEIGLHLKNHKKGILLGLTTGLFIMVAGYLVLDTLNQIEFAETTFMGGEFLMTVLLFLIVSISEEIFFRGYVLRNFMESMNKFVALFGSAFLFALVHAANPNLSLIGNINLFLAGVLLGLPYVYTKNLMFPIAFHFSWNFFQSLFGFNVSGLDSYSLIEFKNTQDTWVSGGDFCFERSVLASVLQIILIVAFYIVFNSKKREKLRIGI